MCVGSKSLLQLRPKDRKPFASTMNKTRSSEPLIENQLATLAKAPVAKLRKAYRAVFKKLPPIAFGPDLLRRSIAYHLQERAYGRLAASTRQELNSVAKSVSLGVTGKLSTPRRIKSGSVLIREWKGVAYRATVMDDGFLYVGKKYTTLSEVAREITGTRWNGPRFFGLRKPALQPIKAKRPTAKRK